MKYLLTFILLLISTSYGGTVKFTEYQKQNLKLACHYGANLVENKGDYCFVFAAITWKETSAGANMGRGRNHPSHGLFQNLLKTVRTRLNQEGIYLPDNEIVMYLQDPGTSAYWAEVELFYWLRVHKGNLNRALRSYNVGHDHRKGIRYAAEVEKMIQYLKRNRHLVGRGQ